MIWKLIFVCLSHFCAYSATLRYGSYIKGVRFKTTFYYCCIADANKVILGLFLFSRRFACLLKKVTQFELNFNGCQWVLYLYVFTELLIYYCLTNKIISHQTPSFIYYSITWAVYWIHYKYLHIHFLFINKREYYFDFRNEKVKILRTWT